jgi:phospholipase C
MNNIEHVVLLMLENRSLDSLLGWLYERDQPLHNVPALKSGERTYDGLQDLDLNRYVNDANLPLKQSIEMSLSGVLAAAKWTDGNILNQDAKRQRQALIRKLVAHSTEKEQFFISKSDDELIGMAGAIIYLLGHGDRKVDDLRRMSIDNQRNTLITVMHWAPGSAFGGLGGGEFADDVTGVKRLAGFVIRSGTTVDAIQAIYERDNGTTFSGPNHGGTGGMQQTITFAPDEVVTEMSGLAGPDGYPLVRQLVIKTNRKPGGYGPFGGVPPQGEPWTFNAKSVGQNPATFRVGGIFGRSGAFVDRIGFFYHPDSLQAKTTKALVEQATRDWAWVKLRIQPIRGANGLNSPNYSPGEAFHEVTCQLYGKATITAEEARVPPGMKGYVKNYVDVLKHERKASDDVIVDYADQVMRSYTPQQLPVLNGLAKHYAVCDAWFSSVPSQTNSNRAFAFCGTSNGLVDNGFLEQDDRAKKIEALVGYKLGDDRFEARTIFNALADGGATWKVFYSSGILQDNIAKAIDAIRAGASVAAVGSLFAGPLVRTLIGVLALIAGIKLLKDGIDLSYLRSLCDGSVDSAFSYRLFPKTAGIPGAKNHFAKLEEFHRAARAGTLPNFTFIEPVWSISPQGTGSGTSSGNFLYHLGDDYHPPSNLDGGESLLKTVYSSLIANTEAWKKTLLIVTFDEPVGSFDHVPPPAAVPPWGAGKAPAKLEQGFTFDRYGGRVPTVLISPLIERGTVFRSETDQPYDHTSLIATLLKWRGLSDKIADFGERTRKAPTFENVITRSAPRTDAADVPFLRGRKLGDEVRYFDRFYLRGQDGYYISTFKEAHPEWAIIPVGEDFAFTEYFPTVGQDAARASLFYCVNPDHRAEDGGIVRYTGPEESRADNSRVKLVSVDPGLGSFNVLGKWLDSRDCYYSNDYTHAALDQKERWLISRADRDGNAGPDILRFGQRVTIQSQYYPEWFLYPDFGFAGGPWLKTSSTDAMWTVLPADLHWTAPASKDDRGSWKDLALSPRAEPLVGLDIIVQGGYGVINVCGLFGVSGNQSTPWTSDDSGGDRKSQRSPHRDDAIAMVCLRNQGDYGIVDVSFTTRKGFRSDWLTNNRDFTQEVAIQVPNDDVVVGLVGRKWAGHGLMDLQLALQAKSALR